MGSRFPAPGRRVGDDEGMTTIASSAVLDVDPLTAPDIIPWKHRLGGPVDVVGYGADGERIGVIYNWITDDEVEVIDGVGVVVRLVATLSVEDAPGE